jgi:hypothetical protein
MRAKVPPLGPGWLDRPDGRTPERVHISPRPPTQSHPPAPAPRTRPATRCTRLGHPTREPYHPRRRAEMSAGGPGGANKSVFINSSILCSFLNVNCVVTLRL